jgi:uncharacterized protein
MRTSILLLAAVFLVMLTFGVARVQSQNLESVFLNAAASGQTDFVKSLLDSGANIESKNRLGATALILASIKGHTRIVKLLLGRGANVNVKTTTGITSLMAAATAGDAEAVKLLLQKGADVSAKDQKGRTALNLAEATGATKVYALLRAVDKPSAPASVPVAAPSGPPLVSVARPTRPASVPVGGPSSTAHTEVIRQADSQSGLTVRAEPSPKGRVIAYLIVGSTVTYSGEGSNGWVKLSSPTAGGWVAASYLGSRNPEASVIDVDNPEQCLRVRGGPGTDREKVGCLPRGAKIKLTGTVQNGWAQIVSPMAGWVTARQIQAPGLFPPKAATAGAQKERRGAAQGSGYRRQHSENDFTQADTEFDKETSELRRDNEEPMSVQQMPPAGRPGGVLRIGPLGIGIGGF